MKLLHCCVFATCYALFLPKAESQYSNSEVRVTTRGQRILPNPVLKPPGYHDSTPPKILLGRSDNRPGLYIETKNNPLSADGRPTINNPPVLNVINTVQTVTIHLWIGDDFTGCKTVEIMASGRDGSDTASIMRQSAPEPSNSHYESTRLNGKWELQKAIPSLSANGTWAIQFVRLQDLQGNVVTIDEQELIQLGVNTKFQVISALCMTSPWLCPEYKQLQDLVNKDSGRNGKQAWIYYYYRKVWYDPVEPVCGHDNCQKPGTFISMETAAEVESVLLKYGKDSEEAYKLNARIFGNWPQRRRMVAYDGVGPVGNDN